ncbi:hypothetical protein MJO28_001396 [Puccinia striiformis f. sp. tritici]|uniref:Hydrophobin n=3 Tax=Puccinia striiformis TaxID=27350 RepID=A0A0L0VQT9_9BASI|nr:uncharacterized protein Pst134EA_031358 [Puccinia striiformis f. sp. tritici]XP_047812185.1 hypothetical protein Pst134EA_003339 [Puccinia striiformis f. sp. tritici]XP_047812190.1 hypothetical protein Pst134EA_003344 [Puccinia striiformis f. sp. tritici]KAI9611522.1 hypothetical protein H4Q26_008476 [Puccinia striiformis f. sp. tritici PST-130]KNF01648.1 hypothetical protein PSTG_05080 [Puccinia striiformis f. sp. tritici PST-78]POW16329.1 hypothetical protein PSTT_01420 [Puccinia striifor
MLCLQLFLVLCVSLGVKAQGFNPAINPNPYKGYRCPTGRVAWSIDSVDQNLASHSVTRASTAVQTPGLPDPGPRFDCPNSAVASGACCSQQFNKVNSPKVVFSDVKSFCLDASGKPFK